MTDIENPLFKSSIEEIIQHCRNNNIKVPYKFFSLLERLYKCGDDSMVYAFSLPVREYKKK